MTDNDIIKALEYCRTHIGVCTDECAYRAMYSGSCVLMLQKDTIDLINRQKAEIERLETEPKEVKVLGVNEIADMIYSTILDCAVSNGIMTYREQARCIANDLIRNDVIPQPLPDLKENQVLYAVIAGKVIDVSFKGLTIADGDIRLNFDHRGLHYHCKANDVNKSVFVLRSEAEKQRRHR